MLTRWVLGLMVAFLAIAAINPGSASAEWRLVECFTGPCYKWFESGVPTDRILLPDQFERIKRAQAAAEATVGATKQSATAIAGPQAAKDGAKVIESIESAGTKARGSLLSQASATRFLPSLATLGTVANAASAFYIGWEIGGAITDIFQDVGDPPVAPVHYGMVAQVYRDEGETVAAQSPAGAIPATVTAKMPAAGTSAMLGLAYGSTKGEGFNKVYDCEKTFEASNHDWEMFGGGIPDPPPNSTLVESPPAFQPSTKCQYRVGFFYVPVQAANLGNGFKGNQTKTGTVPGPVLPAVALAKAQEHLENPRYDPSNGAWAHDRSIGGVSFNEAVEVPVPTFGDHEQLEDYESVLAGVGLEPVPQVLAESAIDPAKGPNEVTSTVPAPGTKVKPGTNVRVRFNPETAPEPSGGGGWSPPSIPSIDLTPLTETGLGCDVFPFGLPCYVYEVIGSLNVDPECPQFEVPLYDGNEMEIDSCVADPILSIWRPVFLFIASIGIVVFFASLAMGGGREAD